MMEKKSLYLFFLCTDISVPYVWSTWKMVSTILLYYSLAVSHISKSKACFIIAEISFAG